MGKGGPRNNQRVLKGHIEGDASRSMNRWFKFLQDSFLFEREEGTAPMWQSKASIREGTQIQQCRAILIDWGRGWHCLDNGIL